MFVPVLGFGGGNDGLGKVDDGQGAVCVQVEVRVRGRQSELLAQRGRPANDGHSFGGDGRLIESGTVVFLVVKGVIGGIVEQSRDWDFAVQTLVAGEELLRQKVGVKKNVLVIANVGALEIGKVQVARRDADLTVLMGGRGKTQRNHHVNDFPGEAEFATHAGVLGFYGLQLIRAAREVQTVFGEARHFVGLGTVVGVREDRVEFVGDHPGVEEVVVQVGVFVWSEIPFGSESNRERTV